MKWSRAVHHLQALAEECALMAERPARLFPLRVIELWAVGDILGPPRDLDVVTVALGVDLPAEEVAWWSEPDGARHWSYAVGMGKNPVRPWWRSAHAPVWNHRIDRPALVWDIAGGIRTATLDALRDGGEVDRLPAPTPEELRARLRDELDISLRGLRAASATYDERRWQPGKIEPLADALWRASDGYLDVLAALES